MGDGGREEEYGEEPEGGDGLNRTCIVLPIEQLGPIQKILEGQALGRVSWSVMGQSLHV